MALAFEWDPEKAAENLKKHGVSFDEAKIVFADRLSRTEIDESSDEERWLTIGQSLQGRTLVVAHVDGEGIIRIISARPATNYERETYEEGD